MRPPKGLAAVVGPDTPGGPCERLRVSLEEQRRFGAGFRGAWPKALARALASIEGGELAAWSEALRATASAWEAAYSYQPAGRPQLALAAIGQDPERNVRLETGRACDRCGEAIPTGKPPQARYCSRQCQRAANGRVAATV